jgi:hypothetical protein
LFSLGICFQTKSNVFKRDRLSTLEGRFLLVRYALYLSSYNKSQPPMIGFMRPLFCMARSLVC